MACLLYAEGQEAKLKAQAARGFAARLSPYGAGNTVLGFYHVLVRKKPKETATFLLKTEYPAFSDMPLFQKLWIRVCPYNCLSLGGAPQARVALSSANAPPLAQRSGSSRVSPAAGRRRAVLDLHQHLGWNIGPSWSPLEHRRAASGTGQSAAPK